MIAANELRIGNYVHFYIEGIQTIGTIRQVDHKHVFIKGDSIMPYMMQNESIDPIPLTEQILLKCGFEKCATMERGEYFEVISIQISNNDCLEFYDDEWQFVNEFSMIRHYFWNRPKFLHQLQNLYFALTGDELNVQL